MGFLKKLFSKKDKDSNSELEILSSTQTGYVGEAEHIANVVEAGLEKGNYVGMNKHLTEIVQNSEEKQRYVFEHPGVVSRYFAIAILSVVTISFIYYLFIGIATSCFSSTSVLYSVGIFFVVISGLFLLCNILLLAKLISTIRFKKRFDVYEEFLNYKSFEFVEDLAICSKQKEAIVLKDLQKAIKQKLIPHGHFSNENRVFMVSNEVYNRYLERPAVYDRYFQKIIEERHRIRSRTEFINQIMETGEKYIEKLQGYSSLIKDKGISRKIVNMQNVVSMIFFEIDMNPNQVQSLGVFLNYYLPTTEKLLDAYVTLDEKGASGNNGSQTKKEIEEAINTIVVAFERILEKLYEEQEMDIASDIEAMELSMKQEGLQI